MRMARQNGLRDICHCRTVCWINFFYVCHLMLIAEMKELSKELIAVKHNYYALYTLFWQHVSNHYGQHQASNIKFIKSTVYICIK
jgi:hypothetical protein